MFVYYKYFVCSQIKIPIKMAKDYWFRHEIWDANIAEDFEAHLKRARGTFSKAQYLRIQGVTLLDTTGERAKLQAVRLLQRVIEEYPMEESQVYRSHWKFRNG